MTKYIPHIIALGLLYSSVPITRFRNLARSRLLSQGQSYLSRPGRKYQNDDTLSRIHCKQRGRPSHNSEPPLDTVIGALTAKRKTTNFHLLEMHDQSIGFIKVAMEKNQQPTSVNVKGKGREAKHPYQLWDRLVRYETLQWLYEDTGVKKNWNHLVLPPSPTFNSSSKTF